MNRYMTAIPARIMVAAEVFLSEDTPMITIAGISENTNAVVTRPMVPPTPATDSPNPNAKVAPNDAPEDIPVV